MAIVQHLAHGEECATSEQVLDGDEVTELAVSLKHIVSLYLGQTGNQRTLPVCKKGSDAIKK